jgi:YesN/AraC family two-component response regulator
LNEITKTVLIVDDEVFIRQSFMDYFEDRLWRVLGAESGEQALEIMETESPHGAIVDIRLGGMDGDALIRKAYLKRPKTAFVICTGSPEYDVPADLLKLPEVSDQVFRKPVTDMARLEKDLLRLIANVETERG